MNCVVFVKFLQNFVMKYWNEIFYGQCNSRTYLHNIAIFCLCQFRNFFSWTTNISDTYLVITFSLYRNLTESRIRTLTCNVCFTAGMSGSSLSSLNQSQLSEPIYSPARAMNSRNILSPNVPERKSSQKRYSQSGNSQMSLSNHQATGERTGYCDNSALVIVQVLS